MYPNIEVETTKNKLSTVLSEYYFQRVELDEVHPDLEDKIQLFISAKKLEGLSSITLDNYLMELSMFADIVKKKAEDITTADVRMYLSQDGTLKMSTIRKKLSVIKSFFSWLASEEYIKRDPTTKLIAPKEEYRLPKSLSIQELEMLRESCDTVRQRAFLEILYATGCRLSEVHGLDKADINLQNMSTLVIGKGDKQREVYFSIRAMYHLDKYLKGRNDNCEALMITERKPYRRLSKRGIQREIGIIAQKAGLQDKVSPHVLRHTFATLTLNNGAE
ncbi:tyrosine-type recombinase/integrase [Bacillus sp. DTU_2020_1000418_1_SI_GHA_SEK_038]|uniref:tyrosine-type recombinase/integrase n=1 Tax=Bacillus sp. DTU_2020_1000418_1_SI_GHA_SEK_038 TaxID=3077585 RepID=UPI0028E32267|nr:tyrosine-type recombinase/integrase [Bacillus sp. DTU_2020_1000418_1_SI_GHA_SEK_038]WNS77345.1 tyrosine-type recombinase/integrase [Bacillus sp. DTU_2020_1000418_1_SI_GHA_SEK_038]